MKISRIITAASVLAILALNGGVAHAAASSLYVTPASATVAMGSTFTVTVVENGDNVNVVTANLSYDASKLSCNGVGGGDFAQTITASCGGGSVSISRYVTPGQPALNGVHAVGSVSFTAIANSGTASLNFLGSSQVASGGVNTLASSVGGVYTLTSNSTSGNNNGSGSTNGSGTSNGATNGTTTTYGPKTTAVASSNTAGTQSNSSTSTTANNNTQSSGVLSDNQNDKKKTDSKAKDGSANNSAEQATKSSNTRRTLLMILGLVAVATGIVFAQRYRENQAMQAKAAAALASKKAKAKKPRNKSTKKTAPKKPATRKK